MTRANLAGAPNLGRPAARCRKRAQVCRSRASKSFYLEDEEAWLRFASEWTELAEAFETHDRLSLN